MLKPLLSLAALLLITVGTKAQPVIPDSLFGSNSFLTIPDPGAAVPGNFLLQPDGNVIYGGYTTGTNNDYFILMSRFDPCGNLDAGFGNAGVVQHTFDQRNIATAFALQPDGKIVVAGMEAPSNAGSQQIPAVSRFNADGTPDTSFSNNGSYPLRFDPVSSGRFYSVYVLADGRIVAIGNSATNINGGVNGGGAMRFMPNGTLDATYDGDGIARHTAPTGMSPVRGYIVNPNRSVFVTTQYDGSFIESFYAFAFDSTGALDNSFGSAGTFLDTAKIISANMASAMQPDGKVVIASNRTNNTGIEVIRLTVQGFLDPTFGNGGRMTLVQSGFTSTAVHVLANNKIFITGAHNSGVGAALQLTSNGQVDAGFGSGGFQFYDINGNTGAHAFDDLLQLPNGDWYTGTAYNDLIVKKYTSQSNVPHLSQSGADLTSTGAGTFEWFLDGNTIGGVTTNTHTATANGLYYVIITDDNGCTRMSAPVAISGIPCSFIAAINPNVLLLCPNATDTLIASPAGAVYQWYKDGAMVPGATNSMYTVDVNVDAGSFFALEATLAGCTDTSEVATVSALTFPPPVVSPSPNGWTDSSGASHICNGDTLVLNLLSPYDTNVQWLDSNAVIVGENSVSLYVTSSGSYTVSAAPSECPDYIQTLDTAITVNVVTATVPVITQSNDTLFANPNTTPYTWYFNGNPIPGENNYWLVPTANGSYQAMLADANGCEGLSSTFPYTGVGIEAIGLSNVFIFPNPVTELVNVTTKEHGFYTLALYDATSRKLLEESFSRNAAIDMSSLTAGVYIYALRNKNGLVENGKIIKQ